MLLTGSAELHRLQFMGGGGGGKGQLCLQYYIQLASPNAKLHSSHSHSGNCLTSCTKWKHFGSSSSSAGKKVHFKNSCLYFCSNHFLCKNDM